MNGADVRNGVDHDIEAVEQEGAVSFWRG